MLVASRPRIPGYLGPATFTRFESRTRLCTYKAAKRVRLVFPRYYIANTGVQSLLPNGFTLTCAIEDPGTNTYAPVTFSGASSLVVTTTGESLIWSDEIGDLPANALRFVRVGCQVSLGQTVPGAQVSPFFDSSIEQAVNTNGASQVFATGAMSVTSPHAQAGVNEGGFTPVAIVGYPVGAQHSVLVWGDSIVDTFDHVPDATGHYGWIARALRLAGIPHTKASRGSNRARNSTPALAPKQYELCQYATHVVIHIGVNDFASTETQIRDALREIFVGCRDRGCKVYASLICPVTTSSTNSWATEEAQDGYGVGAAPGGMRDALNAWMLSLADGTLNGVIDHRQYIENTSNRKWLANASRDGLHPGLNGASPVHAAMAQALLDSIATW